MPGSASSDNLLSTTFYVTKVYLVGSLERRPNICTPFIITVLHYHRFIYGLHLGYTSFIYTVVILEGD